MNEFEKYLEDNTQQQLAQKLGVSQGAISQWITNGEIPIKRVRDVSRITGIPSNKLHPDFSEEAAA